MNNIREAVRLLGVYTAGRFDIWALAGPARASCRAHVMSVLTGTRTPQAKAGVTMMREAFYTVAGDSIVGSCIAQREDAFITWCKGQS